MEKLAALIKQQVEARLKLFRANTLVDLVEKVFMDLKLDYPGKLDEVKDTKKTKTALAALSLNQRQLELFFGDKGKTLGPQYFKVLQNITKVRQSNNHSTSKYLHLDQILISILQYIDGRNESAHPTSTEFALLLNSVWYNKTGEYYKWANLFPYVYGKSVEEIVEDQAAMANQNLEDVEWGPV